MSAQKAVPVESAADVESDQDHPWAIPNEDYAEVASWFDEFAPMATAAKEAVLTLVKRWIVDSGCGHDLIARTLVEHMPELIKGAKRR